MLEQHTPRIDLRYWLGITSASIFGTNLGDVCEHVFGEGVAAVGLSACSPERFFVGVLALLSPAVLGRFSNTRRPQ